MKKLSSATKTFVLGALLTLMIAACGSDGEPETPEGSEAAGEPEVVTIASTGLSGVNYLPLTYAIGAGLFEEENLEIENVTMQSGADVARALLSGSVDFSPLSFQTSVAAAAEGGTLMGFSLLTKHSTLHVLVRTDVANEIQDFSDMQGRLIGVAGLGGGTHEMILFALGEAGIDAADATFVEVGVGPTALAALEQSQIEVLVTNDPGATLAVDQGLAERIWDGRTADATQDLYGNDYAGALVTMTSSRETLEQRPEVAQAFARAIARATDEIEASTPEEVAANVPAELRGLEDEELYLEILEASQSMFAPNGYMPPDAAVLAVEVSSQFNETVAAADLNPEDLYTNEFTEAP